VYIECYVFISYISRAHHFEGVIGFGYVYIEFYVCILYISIAHHLEGVTGFLGMCTSNSTYEMIYQYSASF